MPFSNKTKAFVKRTAAAIALITVTMIGGNTYFRLIKTTDEGESAARNIQCWETSSGGTRACLRETGDLSLSGSLVTQEGNFTVERKYMLITVYGSGATTATGANVFGDIEIPMAGDVVAAFANLGLASDDGLTEVDVNIGGISIFSTTLTIDAAEKSSRTAVTAAVIDTANDDFVAGDIITLDINSPSTTPGSQLFVTLTLDISSTP